MNEVSYLLKPHIHITELTACRTSPTNLSDGYSRTDSEHIQSKDIIWTNSSVLTFLHSVNVHQAAQNWKTENLNSTDNMFIPSNGFTIWSFLTGLFGRVLSATQNKRKKILLVIRLVLSEIKWISFFSPEIIQKS